MVCRLEELHRKEVISVKDGARLGFVGDVELDTDTARLSAIVVYGKLRWLGLLGREEDQIIRWEDIQMIGEETDHQQGQNEGHPQRDEKAGCGTLSPPP